jgi:hypothetical protein
MKQQSTDKKNPNRQVAKNKKQIICRLVIGKEKPKKPKLQRSTSQPNLVHSSQQTPRSLLLPRA